MSKSIEEIDKNFVAEDAEAGLRWYDVRGLKLEGRGWDEVETPYDRLPAKAKTVVRPDVWTLSLHSAGMLVRFVSNTTKVAARWKLRRKVLEMPHMPATGVSGVDLYARDAGRWLFKANGRPSTAPLISLTLGGALTACPQGREFTLYLPLYNGVESVEIGLPSEATMQPAPPRPGSGKPILFYGTSITQGGCASRPGMAYTSIIGRMLDRPTINLGFSGNGQMEPELAHLLAELDPSVYVLDCMGNISPAWVNERIEPFVRILRAARPATPIVLVENVVYYLNLSGAGAPQPSEKNLNHRAVFARLVAAGVKGLHTVPGEGLIGYDGEGTVDGCHPTDLGFQRMAEAIAPVLRPLV